MNFPLPSTMIAAILGDYGPLAKVDAHWPLVESALDGAGVYSPLCAVAAITTIAVETGRFSPIKERGGPTYLANLYENRKDLGNVNPGDGAKFQGRGFIPIVGRREYERFGTEIGKDLAGSPDLALDPPIAAKILAVYFKERDVRTFADQQNWEMVRRRASAIADRTEWPRFIDVATQLVSALKTPRHERWARHSSQSRNSINDEARKRNTAENRYARPRAEYCRKADRPTARRDFGAR